jgi:SAM-dependent methyltransferase
MDKSLLVKLFGFSATLIHGDTLVLDRWRWLKRRLPVTRNGEKLIDIGCGTGSFSLGAARRGYESLGLSWDTHNQTTAALRAKLLHLHSASFEVQDVRYLSERRDLFDRYDVAICFENIEHITDDRKLLTDIANCLKPGGRVLLTTPYLYYRPISAADLGPFSKIEDGGHVRRGYTKTMLEELCQSSGLVPEHISYCSGFLSQKITSLLRALSRIHPLVGWTLILPLRVLPLLFDVLITAVTRWTSFSICLEAYKPRFPRTAGQTRSQAIISPEQSPTRG